MLNLPEELQGLDSTGWLVGGCVRDLLLGRNPMDYDIAVAGAPARIAKALARRTRGRIVELGKPGLALTRIVTPEFIIDLTPLNGPNIDTDLRHRDFTVNAIAYDLQAGRIIDPVGGRKALQQKVIRQVTDDAFKQDPVRLLRAFRMAAILNFNIANDTLMRIKHDAPLISRSAGERVHAELLKMISRPRVAGYIRQMVDAGFWDHLFPEMARMADCRQGRHHEYDVLEHTLQVFGHLETIIGQPPQTPVMQMLHRLITADAKKITLLKIAALMHDSGKPAARSIGSDGRIHFYGHEKKSTGIALNMCRRLKFSNQETTFVESIVRHHQRPLMLFKAENINALTRKGIARFCIRCGEYTPWVLLHAMADMRGKSAAPRAKLQSFNELVQRLLHVYFHEFSVQKNAPPLITGHDLIQDFNLKPSALFKTILNHIAELQIAGQIESREQALDRVRRYLVRHSP